MIPNTLPKISAAKGKTRSNNHSSSNKCSIHGENLTLFCLQDKKEICSHCEHSPGEDGHHGHNICHPVVYAGKKDKILQGGLEKGSNLHQNITSLLGKRESEILDQFNEEEKIFKNCIVETSMKVFAASNKNKKKLNEDYGEGSSFRRGVLDKIEATKKNRFIPMELINQPLEELEVEFSDEKFTQYREIFENGLPDPNSFKILNSSILSINQNNLEDLGNIEICSPLQFKFEEETLEILVKNDPQIQTSINVKEWKEKTKKIVFTFSGFHFKDENFKKAMIVLKYLCKRLLGTVRDVKIAYDGIPLTTVFEAHVIKFAKHVFASPETLQAISIVFINSNGSDQCLRYLAEEVLPKATQLKSLFLHCQDTELSDSALTSFVRELRNDLESLTLNLFDISRLNKNVLTQLKLNLPNLTFFCFGNNFQDNTQEIWETFLRDSLSSMRNLKRCEILFDKGKKLGLNSLLKILTEKTPNLQEFLLDAPEIEPLQSVWDGFVDSLAKSLKEPKAIHMKVFNKYIKRSNDMSVLSQ